MTLIPFVCGRAVITHFLFLAIAIYTFKKPTVLQPLKVDVSLLWKAIMTGEVAGLKEAGTDVKQ